MIDPGPRIRDRRKALGWTLEQLAKRAGLSRGYLCDLERGKRGMDVQTLAALARSLRVSADWIMTGPEAMPAPAQPALGPELTRVAGALDLSFRETLLLARLQDVIDRHRSRPRSAAPDWRRLYERIRPFL